MTDVPFARLSSLSSVTLPASNLIFRAASAPSARDTKVTSLTDAMLASASPRKPSVAIVSRSAISQSLLVACGRNAARISSFKMPEPLSLTDMRLMPPSSMKTEISVAPASMLFSTSSLTTEEGLSTTSPADIILNTPGPRRFILPISRALRVSFSGRSAP